MAAGYSPTLRARRLRTELQRLRRAAGLTLDEAAGQLEWSSTKLSRIELGRVGVEPGRVMELLDLYGITDPDQVQPLVQLAREAKRRGWWYTYRDLMPPWFQLYVDFEEEASSILTYESELIPGLLQIEEYATRAQRGALPKASDAEISRRVAIRMRRQSRLIDEAPRLQAVLNEGALRRYVGNDELRSRQLRHLLEVAELPNVTLQVVPFAAGPHPAMAGTFTILGFPEPADPDVVYVEYRTGALFVEDPGQVEAHHVTFGQLQGVALDPDESTRFISRLVGQ